MSSRSSRKRGSSNEDVDDEDSTISRSSRSSGDGNKDKKVETTEAKNQKEMEPSQEVSIEATQCSKASSTIESEVADEAAQIDVPKTDSSANANMEDENLACNESVNELMDEDTGNSTDGVNDVEEIEDEDDDDGGDRTLGGASTEEDAPMSVTDEDSAGDETEGGKRSTGRRRRKAAANRSAGNKSAATSKLRSAVKQEPVTTESGEVEVVASSQPSSAEIDQPEMHSPSKAKEEESSNENEESNTAASIVTRRSQRRRAKPRELDLDETNGSISQPTDTKVKSETEASQHDTNDEEDDAESVTSEIDSLTSGSTLTTRSALKRGSKRATSNKKVDKKRPASNKSSRSKQKGGSGTGGGQGKGKSRRIIFKKSATKAPSAVARAVTSDRVFYRGQYFTKGDVVSVTDVSGDIFYAQLRGFLTDQYCEKSCVITWLLPTTNSPEPNEAFDPATYVVGPEEEFPRKLEFFTFVMHAPDDYFYYKNAPYPTEGVVADQEYVLTRLGPKVRLINPAGKTVFSDL